MDAPPFIISSDAINLIAEISSLLERYIIAMEGDYGVKLRKVNRIKTIHSSLAIEGNTLSEDEVADIINGKKIVAPIRQVVEVKNAIKVYDAYRSLNPFSEKDLLKAHGIMMEALTDDAGLYRKGGVGVYGEKGLIHMAPPAKMVPQLIGNLMEWLNESKDHLLIRSCVFHYEFEFIHPFSDGNGRMGRLWQSLILGRLNPVFEHVPVENMVFANQENYYNAIYESTKSGQSGPFIDFMLREIRNTILKYKRIEKVPDKVLDKVPNKTQMMIVRLLMESPRMTSTQLAEKIGISSRGVVKAIQSLKRQGILDRVGSNKSGMWKVNSDNNHG